jgi:hypothetical protein
MKPVPEDFEPEERIYLWAARDGIPIEFVKDEINNFIAYWSLRNIRRKNWQVTFWNRIKAKWSYKLAEEKKTKTRCSVPFREMPKIEKSKSTMSLRERLRQG